MDAEALVRRFWQQVFDDRDLAAAAGLVAADLQWRGSLGRETSGLAEFLTYAGAAQLAMPDLRVTLDEVAVHGPQVWARMTFRATHLGELLGVAATGRPIAYVGLAVHDVRDGLLQRVWVVADTLSLHRRIVAAES